MAHPGCTRLFETWRHDFHSGVGFQRHIDHEHSLQFLLRDYWTFTTPRQHNVLLRFACITGLPD